MRPGQAAALLVAVTLVPLASGQSPWSEHGGSTHEHEHEHEHWHDGHEHDGLGHEGQERPGPFGQHAGEGGAGSITGDGDGFERPPPCSATQSADALQASSAYVSCAGLDYADFMSLVHADMEVLRDAATCFEGKVEEMQKEMTPGVKPTEAEQEVLDARMDASLDECAATAEKADETGATEATTNFLNKMLGPDSQICACFPAFVDKMPDCEAWSRFHHFGLRLEELCQHVDTGSTFPGPVQLPTAAEGGKLDDQGHWGPPDDAAKVEEEPRTSSAATAAAAGEGSGDEEHPPHIPNAWGPCPPGQEVHPDNPKECQPAASAQEELDAAAAASAPQVSTEGDTNHGASSSSSSSGGSGGLLGLGLSVLGYVAVGGAVGFAGVWAYGKFKSGTRQPGVRYMAAGVGDDNLGTELGPFGREYA